MIPHQLTIEGDLILKAESIKTRGYRRTIDISPVFAAIKNHYINTTIYGLEKAR